MDIFNATVSDSTHKWTYSTKKNGNKDVLKVSHDMVRQPGYLKKADKYIEEHDGETKVVKGIPYAWSGYDTFTTHSTTKEWDTFDQGISKGNFAGNATSKYGNYVPNAVGLDCSGFASAAYRLGNRRSARELLDNKNFKKSKHRPTAWDIYVKPGHHVVVVEGDVGLPKGKFWVAESANGAGTDRVVLRRRWLKNFPTGYVTGVYLKGSW